MSFDLTENRQEQFDPIKNERRRKNTGIAPKSKMV